MLDHHSPVLETLAELYAESTAGTTGVAARDFGVSFPKLLEAAGCQTGEAFAVAESDLRHAHTKRAVEIDTHRRSHDWQRIRVPLTCETELFELIGQPSPAAEREAWASLFERASSLSVPDTRQRTWQEFCHARAARARAGVGWQPFRRTRRPRAQKHLELTARLLAWERPCLLRTASGQLGVDSKFLEKSATTLQQLLAEASGGAVRAFTDLGIEHNPTTVRFHGPVRVQLRGGETDYTHHEGESSLAEADLAQMEGIHFDAPRCVTVENATKFHELCRLGNGDIFVFTSYPNKATVRFLRLLPPKLPLFHFGDTDPWGFDVLRTLRQSLDRPVLPLHMRYRPKQDSPALSERDRRKLSRLRTEPRLADVHEELQFLAIADRKGDFEQETLMLTQAAFPYVA